MTAVSNAGPSLLDVLQLIGAFAVGAPLGILLGKTVLWFKTLAVRHRRNMFPAAVSPATAGTRAPAADADTSSRRAAASA